MMHGDFNIFNGQVYSKPLHTLKSLKVLQKSILIKTINFIHQHMGLLLPQLWSTPFVQDFVNLHWLSYRNLIFTPGRSYKVPKVYFWFQLIFVANWLFLLGFFRLEARVFWGAVGINKWSIFLCLAQQINKFPGEQRNYLSNLCEPVPKPQK